jgi:hypothetical protein
VRGQIKQLSQYPTTIQSCAELTYGDSSCGDTFELGPDGRCLCGSAGTVNEHCEGENHAGAGSKIYIVEPEDTDVATTVQTAVAAIGEAAAELRERRAARAASAASGANSRSATMLSALVYSS